MTTKKEVFRSDKDGLTRAVEVVLENNSVRVIAYSIGNRGSYQPTMGCSFSADEWELITKGVADVITAHAVPS